MERCRELEQLTRGLYEAVSRAEPSFFRRHLARESCVVIGTAPDEWWDDYEGALAAIEAQMKTAGAASVELVAGEVRAYREGDVGWTADQPTLRLGRVEARCRHTSVFVRSEGEWRIVQHHFSIGVRNEDVFGEEARRLG